MSHLLYIIIFVMYFFLFFFFFLLFNLCLYRQQATKISLSKNNYSSPRVCMWVKSWPTMCALKNSCHILKGSNKFLTNNCSQLFLNCFSTNHHSQLFFNQSLLLTIDLKNSFVIGWSIVSPYSESIILLFIFFFSHILKSSSLFLCTLTSLFFLQTTSHLVCIKTLFCFDLSLFCIIDCI